MDELNQTPQQNNVPPTPLSNPSWPMQNAGIVPPPPTTPEIFVRTMESDAQSVRVSGEPIAQPITPPPPIATATQPLPVMPTAAPVQLPTQNIPSPAPMPDVREMKSGRLLLWFFILVLIVGIGWMTYKYGLPIYHALTPKEPAPEIAVVQPAAPKPSIVNVVIPPPAPTITPLGGIQSALPKIETNGTAISITAALTAEAEKMKSASGTIQEVVLLNTGAPMSFATIINALLPEAKTNGLEGIMSAAFDPVFSTYLYYDDRGTWPGYIAKINPASQIDAATLTSRLQAIEKSSYKNFFLSDPGAPSTFRTGQAREKYIDRFIPLATEGALFNYGIFGDYVIINTSNNGLVKALDLLKL